MRKFLHRFELRIAAVAAVALLLAQLGAISHAYSHDLAAAHQSGASSTHATCNDCLGYAPVLSGAGTTGTLPFIDTLNHGSVAHAAACCRVDYSLNLAFRSRAPPTTSQVF